MKNLNRITVFVFVVCLGMISITGCSENKKDEKATGSETTEVDTVADDKQTAEQAVKYENTHYELSDEIKNADFHSGLIQIGNTVFRNGGYCTFEELIEEYGDRFDFSDIDINKTEQNYASDLNGEISDVYDAKYSSAISSLNDQTLMIRVLYGCALKDGQPHEFRLGDAVVYSVSPYDHFEEAPIDVWYPTGIKKGKPDMDYDEMMDFIKNEKLEKVNDYSYETDSADCYEEQDGMINLHFRLNDKNLFGEYPVESYLFLYDEETHGVTGFE